MSTQVKSPKNALPEESPQTLIKKCHVCGFLNEDSQEMQRCCSCNKSFLPLNYFSKMSSDLDHGLQYLFCHCNELTDDDIIRGLYVLW